MLNEKQFRLDKYESSNWIKPNMRKPLFPSMTQLLITNPTERQDKEEHDLYRFIWPLLCFGRVFGIVPLSGLFNKNLDYVKFEYKSLAGVTWTLCTFSLVTYVVIQIAAFFLSAHSNDPYDLLENLAEFVFGFLGLHFYYFMYAQSSSLLDILYKWRETRPLCTQCGQFLFQKILFITFISLFSGFVENIGSHWQFFRYFYVKDQVKNTSICEVFMRSMFPQVQKIVPNSCTLAIFHFIADKLIVYAWLCRDTLIIIIALSLARRFQNLQHRFEEAVGDGTFKSSNAKTWNQICEEHNNHIDLLLLMADFLSPIIFACVVSCIYFISLTVIRFLVPSESDDLVENVYEGYNLILLSTRTFMVISSCAEVNYQAHKLEQLLFKCPLAAFTREVQKTDLRLRTSTFGFHGKNCFFITKSFVLSVLNAIFSIEIVVLQSSGKKHE